MWVGVKGSLHRHRYGDDLTLLAAGLSVLGFTLARPARQFQPAQRCVEKLQSPSSIAPHTRRDPVLYHHRGASPLSNALNITTMSLFANFCTLVYSRRFKLWQRDFIIIFQDVQPRFEVVLPKKDVWKKSLLMISRLNDIISRVL